MSAESAGHSPIHPTSFIATMAINEPKRTDSAVDEAFSQESEDREDQRDQEDAHAEGSTPRRRS